MKVDYFSRFLMSKLKLKIVIKISKRILRVFESNLFKDNLI